MKEELPKRWVKGTLNEIVNSIKTGMQEYHGIKRYYSTGSIKHNSLLSEGSYTYKKRPSRANRISKLNDVFQARMKDTDKGLLVDENLSGQLFSTGFIQLRVYDHTFSPDLLFYFIKSHYFLNQRDRLATGSTQEALTDIKAKELVFVLPPYNEQMLIVKKLDSIMPRIDTVKERLERIPQIIKRFRQSVLMTAVTGNLTEKWREKHPELTNNENQFFNITHKVKLSREEYILKWRRHLPNKWASVCLGNVADLRLGKMLDKSKNRGKKVPYLRNLNVRWMSFDLSDINTLFAHDKEIENLSIKNGDVFICEGGEPGRAAVWKSNDSKYIFQKAIHRARLKFGIKSDWLVYNLKVDAYVNKLDELFTGTTIKHLTGRSLAKYPIPLPPLEEQREIVRQVEKLFALADELEAHYRKAKVKIDRLSQAVLAKAFRGELVPQDPFDEPAEKLLERIKGEKMRFETELKKNRIKKIARTK